MNTLLGHIAWPRHQSDFGSKFFYLWFLTLTVFFPIGYGVGIVREVLRKGTKEATLPELRLGSQWFMGLRVGVLATLLTILWGMILLFLALLVFDYYAGRFRGGLGRRYAHFAQSLRPPLCQPRSLRLYAFRRVLLVYSLELALSALTLYLPRAPTFPSLISFLSLLVTNRLRLDGHSLLYRPVDARLPGGVG